MNTALSWSLSNLPAQPASNLPPQPAPDWNAPFVGGFVNVLGAILAFVFLAALAGALVGLILVALGHFGDNSRMKSLGLKGIVGGLIVAAVAGSLWGLFAWVMANVVI